MNLRTTNSLSNHDDMVVALSYTEPVYTEIFPFTVRYHFLGQEKMCELKVAREKESVVYKCRLLPSAMEITITQIKTANTSQWIHTKGIVNDLAEAIGKSLEQQFVLE
jgi:hypothetical protein